MTGPISIYRTNFSNYVLDNCQSKVPLYREDRGARKNNTSISCRSERPVAMIDVSLRDYTLLNIKNDPKTHQNLKNNLSIPTHKMNIYVKFQ